MTTSTTTENQQVAPSCEDRKACVFAFYCKNFTPEGAPLSVGDISGGPRPITSTLVYSNAEVETLHLPDLVKMEEPKDV